MRYRIIILKNADGNSVERSIGNFEINEVHRYWVKAIKRFPKSISYIAEDTNEG